MDGLNELSVGQEFLRVGVQASNLGSASFIKALDAASTYFLRYLALCRDWNTVASELAKSARIPIDKRYHHADDQSADNFGSS